MMLHSIWGHTPNQVGGDKFSNSKKRMKKFAPRVLDLSQKHPIWAVLALVLYEC
jgi:hypothetical protein